MELKKFDELGLSSSMLKAIDKIGYKEATPIQADCIPLILEGKDVIGHSQTGTGKTMAFAIPAVELIDQSSRAVQVLILCPTRELALQASGEIRKITGFKENIKTLAVYGGEPIEYQIKALRQGVQIVVGTPGRIMDHMRRKTLKLENLKVMVLDEADEMLNMGFREDIEVILQDVPDERITVLFSATMSKSILDITKNYQKDAKLVKAVTSNLTANNIEQWYVHINQRQKLDAVLCQLAYNRPRLSLIFCNTKRMVDDLVEKLQQNKQNAVALHGDLNQNQRNRVMAAFRTGAIPILVATDVAARGLDVDNVDIIINYDIPLDNEYYVHRIGRTGRAGKSGKAVTLVTGPRQSRQMADLARYIKADIEKRDMPSNEDIKSVEKTIFKKAVEKEVAKDKFEVYSGLIEEIISDGYDINDVTAALISMTLGRRKTKEFSFDKKHLHENRGATGRSGAQNFNATGAKNGMTRFFINVGKKDNLVPKDIVGIMSSETDVNRDDVGKIDIYDSFSFIEVPEKHATNVLDSLKKLTLRGRKISIEPARAKNGGGGRSRDRGGSRDFKRRDGRSSKRSNGRDFKRRDKINS